MRNQSHGGWVTSFLFAVVLPRVLGSLIPLLMYLESNGFRIDSGVLQSRVMSGVIGFVMLHTRTGRRLAYAGWLFMIPVLVLNMGVEERAEEAFQTLLWWLLIGALWFVDWRRIVRSVNGSRSSQGTRRPVRKEVIRESRVAYGDAAGRA